MLYNFKDVIRFNTSFVFRFGLFGIKPSVPDKEIMNYVGVALCVSLDVFFCFFTISYFIFQFDTGFLFRDASMAYILFIGYMRLSTHLVLCILSNPRIYIVVLLYKSLFLNQSLSLRYLCI
jgi:hypothetical protein